MQQADAALAVNYRLSHARRSLIFEAIKGGYREQRWTLASPDFELVREGDGEVIRRRDGAAFLTVSLIARPGLERLAKNYQPIARYGANGVLIYTGHFWPVTVKDERFDAVFDFSPAAGARAAAFSDYADRLEHWRSPMNHPAFVYMGPAAPVETPDVLAVVDPSAPPWIVDAFYTLTPRALSWMAEHFGFSLETKPNLLLAAPLGDEAGRLSYSGDALPGQFQITLEGGAWREKSDKALTIFRFSTLHEAAHLWQAATQPGTAKTSPWIHEGAADAIAAEAMVGLGYWDEAAFEKDFNEARAECADRLRMGSLASAEERRDFRALYACGHVIAVAVSWADGAPVSDFWRDFIARTGADGYDRDDFFDLAAARSGDPDFVKTLRLFVTTPPAEPPREIDKLLAAAGAPLAP